MELPALFFCLKTPSHFSGHYIYALPSDNEFLENWLFVKKQEAKYYQIQRIVTRYKDEPSSRYQHSSVSIHGSVSIYGSFPSKTKLYKHSPESAIQSPLIKLACVTGWSRSSLTKEEESEWHQTSSRQCSHPFNILWEEDAQPRIPNSPWTVPRKQREHELQSLRGVNRDSGKQT